MHRDVSCNAVPAIPVTYVSMLAAGEQEIHRAATRT
jgi:hypothetical protein